MKKGFSYNWDIRRCFQDKPAEFYISKNTIHSTNIDIFATPDDGVPAIFGELHATLDRKLRLVPEYDIKFDNPPQANYSITSEAKLRLFAITDYLHKNIENYKDN